MISLEKKEIDDRILTLQHCCFETLQGELKYIDEFYPLKTSVIIYFHPECEHCQYEALQIGKNPEQFRKANMILISADTIAENVKGFAAQYDLKEIGNLTILLDRKNRFEQCFGAAMIPSVYIYGANKKLIKRYCGETKISAIISQI